MNKLHYLSDEGKGLKTANTTETFCQKKVVWAELFFLKQMGTISISKHLDTCGQGLGAVRS